MTGEIFIARVIHGGLADRSGEREHVIPRYNGFVVPSNTSPSVVTLSRHDTHKLAGDFSPRVVDFHPTTAAVLQLNVRVLCSFLPFRQTEP